MKHVLSRMLDGGVILVLAFTVSAAASQSNSTTSNSQTTVTGCLSGTNDEGVYVLKSGNGRAVEVGGNDQLKQHVGHTVRLTGTWAKSGSEIGENESAEKNEKGESSEHHGVAERHFKVSDIHHIADSCSESGPKSPTQ
jgi:hypothetical protein